MALERSQVSANTEVELISLCYKDAPLVDGQPGQLLLPGRYKAKELPDGAFAAGLVREAAKESEPEEKPKATAAKAKADEPKTSEEGDSK